MAPPALRRADADEVHVRGSDGLGEVGREAEPAGATCFGMSSGRPGSKNGTPPAASAATFAGSASTPMTSKPISAMAAACVAPR